MDVTVEKIRQNNQTAHAHCVIVTAHGPRPILFVRFICPRSSLINDPPSLHVTKQAFLTVVAS